MKRTQKSSGEQAKPSAIRTLGPVSDLERHLPTEWWKTLFNALYLKTDGDVVENDSNTHHDIDLLLEKTHLAHDAHILDLCCGQGRHCLELAKRGFHSITGIDRSRYLIRLARKRAKNNGLQVSFSEGDARNIRLPASSQDCVIVMGNSFGYFEREEDDHAVLIAIKHVLQSKGTLVLDIVDGAWMKKHFEPRSWEWIDQNHFVCRERSLAANGQRIISREVISHAEMGILADQFYAERLYTEEEITTILTQFGFTEITFHKGIVSHSTRQQDLGMMENRMFIMATAPVKIQPAPKKSVSIPVTVILGDIHLPDPVKKDGKFNAEDLHTITTLKENLLTLSGYSFHYLDNHTTLLKHLLASPPPFVLNLCDEGYYNQAECELHVPALLEILKIPYSGAAPACLALCYNKAHIRAIAQDLNIPVPLETYFDPSDQAANLPSIFPSLLKPNYGDSSIGITQDAVVHNARELMAYLHKLQEHFPDTPILIQEFLSGTEYSVALLGNRDRLEPLPILEVDYCQLPSSYPQLLSYESKWLPDSPYWQNISYKEACLDEETRRKLIDYSVVLFERLGCRDYARFDFRTDSQGTIKLLEVNPNPGWCWDGKVNLMAGFAHISYQQLLQKIITIARERYAML